MKTYATFRPTQFDTAGLGLYEQHDWLVAPVSRTRDSEALDRANFDATLQALGGESETVQVHRFGHWGPGWFEIILIDPNDSERVKIAEDIETGLEDYPVVDECLLSEYENAEYQEAWAHWLPGDFARVLKSALGLSDTAEWRLSDSDVPLQELYEELMPGGDYWQENGMHSRLEHAAGRCTRERMAAFLRKYRKAAVK